jgi:hypothetical protein
LTPNQATFSAGAKIIKGQLEIRWQDVHILEPDSGTHPAEIPNPAGNHAASAAKKKQRALNHFSSAHRPPLIHDGFQRIFCTPTAVHCDVARLFHKPTALQSNALE